MSRYAENTSVSSEQSRNEIERTLQRYGANSFMYGWDELVAIIRFRMDDRFVEFRLPMPDKAADEFRYHSRGERTQEASTKLWEQATRQRWRALALVVKAKLEAVESEITTFEDEFMAHILLPDGSTVGSFMKPQIKLAYDTKVMPSMLALPKPK